MGITFKNLPIQLGSQYFANRRKNGLRNQTNPFFRLTPEHSDDGEDDPALSTSPGPAVLKVESSSPTFASVAAAGGSSDRQQRPSAAPPMAARRAADSGSDMEGSGGGMDESPPPAIHCTNFAEDI